MLKQVSIKVWELQRTESALTTALTANYWNLMIRNRANLLAKTELAVGDLAEAHAPPTTVISAVIDQWLTAIATDSEIYCNPEVNERSVLKKEILSRIRAKGLYAPKAKLFNIMFEDLKLRPSIRPKFRFVDLYAGIGGMRLGFQKAGGICIFSSEIDKHARETYSANHGETPFGDITLVPAHAIPDHDVLLAGFPCQPFSHAGLKRGINDTRGTHFHNLAIILAAKKPTFALLENVRGLVSHDKGRTLSIILRALTEIGYSCMIPKEVILRGEVNEIQKYARAMVLKSCDFGVPQNRHRIYIVLWRDDMVDSFEYPKPIREATRVGDILENHADTKLTISDRLWEGHQRRKMQNKLNGKGFGYGLVTEESPYTNTISARYYKDGSEILVAQKNQNPRKLSTREAARLQGFPEEFEPNKSSVQAYKQFGNSVSVPVVSAIANKIGEKIDAFNRLK